MILDIIAVQLLVYMVTCLNAWNMDIFNFYTLL